MIQLLKQNISASNLGALSTICHGFCTRHGGVSSSIYSSLNCGLGSNDATKNVIQNRNIALASVMNNRDSQTYSTNIIEAHQLVCLKQIHSTNVINLTTQKLEQINSTDNSDSLLTADAIITKLPRVALGVITADCCPILLAEPTNNIIAAAHSGWKGTLHNIAAKTVEKMIINGADPNNIIAAIGPTISSEVYEVGEELKEQFIQENSANSEFFIKTKSNKTHLDLPAMISNQLTIAGVTNIDNVGVCTYKNKNDYFSNRRRFHENETDFGRQISIIALNID